MKQTRPRGLVTTSIIAHGKPELAFPVEFVYDRTMREFVEGGTAGYCVDVDWAPAYELMVSLKAYASTADRKILELGAAWVKGVRECLSPELAADLARRDAVGKMPWLDLLVRQCPEPRDASGFLGWLAQLSAGEMYERLAPLSATNHPLPNDLGALRDRSIDTLSRWDEQYFRHVDPAILHGLEREAGATRALVAVTDPVDLIERATNGVHLLAPEPSPEVVLLIPQYHYRPWNVFSVYRGMRIIQYPVDAAPPAPGDLPPGLLRLTRALSDDSRLRILRFLAAGPQSFMSVVQFSGLAKSTVHHHMVVLRAAGLVRVHSYQRGDMTDTYSLRPHALDELDRRLRAFFMGE